MSEGSDSIDQSLGRKPGSEIGNVPVIGRGPSLFGADTQLRLFSKALEIRLGEEFVRSDSITREDLTGKWRPRVSKDGSVVIKEVGGQWFFEVLRESVYGQLYRECQEGKMCVEELYKQAGRQTREYLDNLNKEGVKISRYGLILPGDVRLHYYLIGKVLPGLSADMPTNLMGLTEAWLQFRTKLSLKERETKTERELIYFDLLDFKEKGEAVLLENTARKHFSLYGFANLPACAVTASGQEGKLGYLPAIEMDRKEWKLNAWHELAHLVEDLYRLLPKETTLPVSEGFAVFCSVINQTSLEGVIQELRRYWKIPEIKTTDLFKLYGSNFAESKKVEANKIYGLSGAFIWFVYHKLGAQTMLKFCNLVGNGSNEDGKGRFLLSLEQAVGQQVQDFNPEFFAESFTQEINELVTLY